MERHSNLEPILTPTGLSRSNSSHFRSLTSAFYAAEQCMNFSESLNKDLSSPQESNLSQPLITLDSSSKVVSSSEENSRCLNTLESLLTSSSICNSNAISSKKSLKNPCKSIPIGRVFMLMQIDSAAKNKTSTCNFPHAQFIPPTVSKSSKIEKQPTVHSPRIISFTSTIPHEVNILGSSASAAEYTRFKWRGEAHELFVKCVNDLGGAKKATPKEILRLMNIKGLTLFHVKSHLQKYRTSKNISGSTEGNQVANALRLQIDIQKRLCEQLEDQRNLQLQIEEQRKQLQNMIDQIKKIGDGKSS